MSLAGSERGDEAEQAGLNSTPTPRPRPRPNETTPPARPALPGPGPQPTGKQNLSAFIWSVADLLRGDDTQSDHAKANLPFTVPRRLDRVLEPTKPDVLEEKTVREGQAPPSAVPAERGGPELPQHRTARQDAARRCSPAASDERRARSAATCWKTLWSSSSAYRRMCSASQAAVPWRAPPPGTAPPPRDQQELRHQRQALRGDLR